MHDAAGHRHIVDPRQVPLDVLQQREHFRLRQLQVVEVHLQ